MVSTYEFGMQLLLWYCDCVSWRFYLLIPTTLHHVVAQKDIKVSV